MHTKKYGLLDRQQAKGFGSTDLSYRFHLHASPALFTVERCVNRLINIVS